MEKSSIRPIIGMALMSLIVCGLVFPLVVTSLGQALFPAQANGSMVQMSAGGRTRDVGSSLIAQVFNSPMFLHSRANKSASLVDPDVPLQSALNQVPRIHAATGIPSTAISEIIQKHVEGVYWIFGNPYVNVLEVNLALVGEYPRVYNSTIAR